MSGAHERVVINICESDEEADGVSGAVLYGGGGPGESVAVDALHEHREMIRALGIAQNDCITVESTTPNQFSFPGTTQYARFVATWQNASTKKIRLLFHGTPDTNIDSILSNGLDPDRRERQLLGKGDYFADAVKKCMQYCRGAKRIIVFAVLMDSQLVVHDAKGVVVSTGADGQLPLATITFSQTAVQAKRVIHSQCLVWLTRLISQIPHQQHHRRDRWCPLRLVSFVELYKTNKIQDRLKAMNFPDLPVYKSAMEHVVRVSVTRAIAAINFKCGDVVNYRPYEQATYFQRATIKRIHQQVSMVPSFTILLDGTERHTEFGHIFPLSTNPTPPADPVAAPAVGVAAPAVGEARVLVRVPANHTDGDPVKINYYGRVYSYAVPTGTGAGQFFAARVSGPPPPSPRPPASTTDIDVLLAAASAVAAAEAAAPVASLTGVASAFVMAHVQAQKVLGKRTYTQFHVVDSASGRFVKILIPPGTQAGSKVTFVFDRELYTFEVPANLTSSVLCVELP